MTHRSLHRRSGPRRSGRSKSDGLRDARPLLRGCSRRIRRSSRRLSLKRKPPMAESPSVLAPSPIDEESLARAEKFTLEPFVHEGEDAAVVLAEGTPRRHALDEALSELDEGRREPSVGWRRNYSLMLGLERLLAQEEPHLVDGTVLSAHQVDALSGTLIALLAEAQDAGRGTNGG